MRYRLLIISLLIFVACKNSSKDSNSGENEVLTIQDDSKSGIEKPEIAFDELKYNFGTIHAGTTISHKFKFFNRGRVPLLIKNVTATCGCTIVDYPHKPVYPNEFSYISADFNSVGKTGLQNKVITVTTNADEPFVLLQLEGKVL